MSKPCISVIVPIYNVEKYLDRCIESIINQTLENIEIILVDDESPDLCPQKCDEAAKCDNRITVIHKKNEGLGFARNSGLDIATGEYVYFVDSDDYLDIQAAEKLYKAAIRDDLDICFAGVVSEDENGKQRNEIPKYAGIIFEQPQIVDIVLAGMLGAEPDAKKDTNLRMSAWQGIYRRAWLDENELRFPSERQFISEDIIFHLDALPKAKTLGYIEDCLFYHIIDNPNSLTHKYNPERFAKCCILYSEEKRKISQLNNRSHMILNAQRMFLGNTRVCLKQIAAKSETEGKAFAISEIKKIVEEKTIREVLREYPYWKNPIKQAIMSFLLKSKRINIVYFLAKIVNKT